MRSYLGLVHLEKYSLTEDLIPVPSQMMQAVSNALGIQWQLHMPYRTQASGQVERLYHMIKQQIAKIWQEVHLFWYQSLPIAFIRLNKT